MQALLADFKRGDLSKEEYQEAITDLLETDYGWNTFQCELNKALNCYTDFRVELLIGLGKLKLMTKVLISNLGPIGSFYIISHYNYIILFIICQI